jgi:integrase
MIAKITKRTVDTTGPAHRDTFIWDSVVSGFGLKVTPVGRKIYVIQYRHDRRIRRYTIGTHGSPWTPDQARKEALRLMGEVASGVDPMENRSAERKTITVHELCELYLAEGCATKKPSTLRTDRGRIARHVIPLLGRKRVRNVKRGDIERFLQDVAKGKTASDVKTGLRGRAIVRGGRGTASRTLGLLGAIFTFAINRGFREDNPVRGVKRFRDKKRERFLTENEFTRLGRTIREAEASGTSSVSVISAIRLLILTGARVSEILTLRWEYVDFERRILKLPDSKTDEKIIHLNPPALDLLRSLHLIEGNPFVFPGGNAGSRLVNLNKPWLRIRKLAELPDVRLHDLRHSFASVGVQQGLGLPIIGELLGHRDTSTTDRYSHLSANPLVKANDMIGKLIFEALNNGTSVSSLFQPTS